MLVCCGLGEGSIGADLANGALEDVRIEGRARDCDNSFCETVREMSSQS